MKKALFLLILLSFVNLQYAGYADGLLPAKAPASPALAVVQPAVSIPVAQSAQQAQATTCAPRIEVTAQPVTLTSRLRGQYKGFNYTISNVSGSPLELLNAEVINGQNGQGAALGVQKSSAAAIGTAIGGGLVLGLVTFGITFLVGLVASPFIYGANHHANTKAIAEGVGYSNQVPTGIMNNGDSIRFSTLVPISQTPQVKMTFRNMATNEIASLTK